MKALLFALPLVLTAQAFAQRGPRVIYGQDHRKDVFETQNHAYVEASKSTAAMIDMKNLRQFRRGEVAINAPTLIQRRMCPTERFAKQITAANCSGFIVAPNILVTAGHCIVDQEDCSTYKWVFDYKVDHADQGIINVPETSIYSCKRIIARSLDRPTMNDFAVIELNRPVLDRQPLKFRRQGRIAMNTPVVVIGHPTGLPTKIADGANVRKLENNFFVANLDTYGGNSGSAVFNAQTSEVEGILVRGANDYVMDSAKNCYVSNVCPDTGCSGESSTYITNIPALRSIRR